MKNDFKDGKLRWDLLDMESIESVVKILTMGANKYAPNNFQKVENGRERYYAACLRHIVAWRKGEKMDEESSESHLSHAMCNLLFMMWFDREEEI